MNIVKRKLIRFGNSRAITIPKELLTLHSLNNNKYIYVGLLSSDEAHKYEDHLNDFNN